MPTVSQRDTSLAVVTGRGLPLLLTLVACAPKNLSIGPVDHDVAVVDASTKDTGAPPTDVTRPDSTVASDVPEADIYVDVPGGDRPRSAPRRRGV